MNKIIQGDALTTLRTLPSNSVQTCITSPPYFNLRDYGVPGQIGLEETPELYIAKLVEVFREVRRVLKESGTLWITIGDSYAGSGKGGQSDEKRSENWQPTYANKGLIPRGYKPKDLMMIPARLAIALQQDGYYLRSDIIWNKPACMPESVTDRPTKSHEYVFLLAKSEHYYYDAEAIKEPARDWGTRDRSKGKYTSGLVPIAGGAHKGLTDSNNAVTGRNKRSVWHINPHPYQEAHFATFPPKLVEPCILAGTSPQACEHCLAPWERVTETTGGTWEQRKEAGVPMRYGLQSSKGTPVNTMGRTETRTLDWQPTCKCENNIGSGKCVVLDPFCGAGTVCLVALQHNREYLAIELNPDYVILIQKRIETIQPVLWEVSA